MKTVKVSELSGAELDWATAKAIGAEKIECGHDEEAISVDVGHTLYSGCWEVSRDWEQCGPLVDKYRIGFDCSGFEICVRARVTAKGMPVESERWQYGNTHMQAACRAIVAAYFGESAEVPSILW